MTSSIVIRIPKATIDSLRKINKTFDSIGDDAELVRSALNQFIKEKRPFLPFEEYHYKGKIYGPWTMTQIAKSADEGDRESKKLLSEIEKYSIVCDSDHRPISDPQ